MFRSYNTFCRFYTRSEALHLMKNVRGRILLQDYNVGILKVEVQLIFIIGLLIGPNYPGISRFLIL